MIDRKTLLIDKGSPIPLYEQLRRELLKAIREGRIPVGGKLPTEEELGAALGVSRPVARQAYNALIEAGYVERMRGRGTFVRRQDGRGRFLNRQLSFAKEMELLGLPHRTELLRQEWVCDAPQLLDELRLTPPERCLHLVRMRYVSDEPFVLVENYIPEPVFPGIGRFDFVQRSLYDVFESEYHIHVTRSQRQIRARIATAEQARLLGARRAAPVLAVRNLAFDGYGRPIDRSTEYLNGDIRSFEFEVVNP